MQTLKNASTRVSTTSRASSVRVSAVHRPQQPTTSTQGSMHPVLAVAMSSLLALNMTAAALTPPPALAETETADGKIMSKAAERKEKMRQARLKAEAGPAGAIPCVTIGCSADSDEAAAERKASSEKAKADVQARAAAFYETERKRNEESFQGVEAKSSFTGEQESLLKERIRQAEEDGTAGKASETKAPAKVEALLGSGIFGSSSD